MEGEALFRVEPDAVGVGDLDAGDPQDPVVGVDQQRQAVPIEARYVPRLEEAAQIDRSGGAERPEAIAGAPRAQAPRRGRAARVEDRVQGPFRGRRRRLVRKWIGGWALDPGSDPGGWSRSS